VSEAGTLSYPLIGSVQVGGITLPAAEKKIGDLLREGGFVLNPQVNILITTALGGLVSVIGEVNTPGRYSIEAAGGHLSGRRNRAHRFRHCNRHRHPRRQTFPARD
jgi:polysaccharide export outer membrane protein